MNSRGNSVKTGMVTKGNCCCFGHNFVSVQKEKKFSSESKKLLSKN